MADFGAFPLAGDLELQPGAAGQLSTLSRYADLSATQLVATSTYGYDSAGRLTSLAHTQNSTGLVDYAWSYDALNRLTQSVNSLDGTLDYAYDPVGQLLSVTSPQSPAPSPPESYSYDSAGNRTNSGYQTGSNNQLLSDGAFTYSYDAEGNRASRTRMSEDPADDFTTEYTWDHRNRLTAVTFKNNAGTVTKTVTYTYDAFDRLIGKQVDTDGDGLTDHREAYVCDGDQIVLQFAGDCPDFAQQNGTVPLNANDLAHRYLWGAAVDQLLADEHLTPLPAGGFDLTQPGEVVWPLTDHQGTLRDLVVRNAQTGVTTIANHRAFDSFGKLTSETNATIDSLFGHTGQLFDADVGLSNHRARWYDADNGRFLSEDPSGFGGGDANLYRYVGNDPLNNTDPTGLHNHPVEYQPSGSDDEGKIGALMWGGEGPVGVLGPGEEGGGIFGGGGLGEEEEEEDDPRVGGGDGKGKGGDDGGGGRPLQDTNKGLGTAETGLATLAGYGKDFLQGGAEVANGVTNTPFGWENTLRSIANVGIEGVNDLIKMSNLGNTLGSIPTFSMVSAPEWSRNLFASSPEWSRQLNMAGGEAIGNVAAGKMLSTIGGGANQGGATVRNTQRLTTPPNRGFDGSSGRASVIPGRRVDRYGGPGGSFLSPAGTPASARSLSPGGAQRPLYTYEVVKPFEVDAGRAAAWYNQPGKGMQYDLGKVTVQELIDGGFLIQVK